MDFSGINPYGGHGGPPPMPAEGVGDMAANDPMGQQGGVDPRQGMGGGGGSSVDPEARMRAETHAKAQDPAIPYGWTGGREYMTHHQGQRVQDWMNKSDWDGDMRWPPPDFLQSEALRGNRIQAMERQGQEIAWQMGQTQMSQMRREQAEADMWAARARQGYSANPYAQDPWANR